MTRSRCVRKSRLFIAFALLALSPSVNSATIDFEGLTDGTFVTTQFTDLTVSNAVVLTAGISLNELDFPPFSGTNVASDSGGPIAILFASPALNFLGYLTYTIPVTFEGFDSSDNLLASATSLFANNTVSGGDLGSSPNEVLSIVSGTGFAKVVITGDPSGSSFTLDDATFTLASTAIPEPGTIGMSSIGLAVLWLIKKARRRS